VVDLVATRVRRGRSSGERIELAWNDNMDLVVRLQHGLLGSGKREQGDDWRRAWWIQR
jgi:hypothetical protein